MNYEKKNFVKNVAIVFINNIISLIAGIIVSFGVPKIMSMVDYSEYKIIMLYLSYIGLLHFGIIDGVVIKYAGKSEDEVGLEKYRTVTRLLILIEVSLSIIIMLSSFVFSNSIFFVGIVLSLDCVFHNITSYYRSVLQISSRYNEYTISGIFGNVYRIVGVLVLYLLRLTATIDYKLYIFIYLFGELSQMIICFYMCKNITIGKSLRVTEITDDIKNLFLSGLPMLISGLVITLISNMDRQFVSSLFSKNDYAIYSFSYSLMNVITTMISSLSIVLYPFIKRKSSGYLVGYYKKFSTIVSIIVFAFFSFVPVIKIFVNWFLPSYNESLSILVVIFPLIVPTTIIQIVIVNFYKAIEKADKYLIISFIALIFTIMFDGCSYIIYRSMQTIAIGSLISCMLWLIISDYYIKHTLSFTSNIIYYVIIMIIVYYISYVILPINQDIVKGILYLFSYIVITLCFYLSKLQLWRNK